METAVFYSLFVLLGGILCISCIVQRLDKDYAQKNMESAVFSSVLFILGVAAYLIFNVNSVSLFLLILLAFLEFAVLVHDLILLFFIVKVRKKGISPADDKTVSALSLKSFLGCFRNDKNNVIAFRKRFLIVLIPLVSFNYMVMIYGVYELFFYNLNDWKYDFNDIVIPSLTAFAVLSLSAALILALIFRSENIKAAAVFITGLTLISYIQNLLLNKSFIIDGTNYPSDAARSAEGMLNCFIWALVCFGVVILWAVLKKKRTVTFKVSVWLSVTLFVMQLAPLPTFFVKAPASAFDKSKNQKYILNGASQFEISDKENIIVFIMDTFSRDDMEDFLEEHSEYREVLSDCVWFDNVNTEAFCTAFSMPALMTATPQDYTISIGEANKRCWNSENAEYFYDTLHKNGFRVNFYTDSDLYSGDANNMIGKIDNVVEAPEMVTEKLSTYRKMVKLSLFKYSPEMMKPDFLVSSAYEINQYTDFADDFNYNVSSWRAGSGASGIKEITYLNKDVTAAVNSGLVINDEDKLCTFTHINGMHEPYDNNYSRMQAIQQCVDIYAGYIEQLKKTGAYDSSTIILTADHGYHSFYESQPVMLIKPKNYTNDTLQVNSAPGNLQSDLLPTILDCHGMDKGDMGYSLFEIDPAEKRLRVCRNFKYDDDYPKADKLNALGNAQFNCYDEYFYYGNIKDVDMEADHKTYPIKDFWS